MGNLNARETLAANLQQLMGTNPKLKNPQAIETATAGAGRKVGRSTVQRILDADTPVNIDFVEVLAQVFKVEPWQLMAENLGRGMSTSNAPPGLGESLAGLATALQRVAPGDHETVTAMLKSFVSDPKKHRRVHQQLQLLLDEQDVAEEVEGDDFEDNPPKAKPPAKQVGGRIKAPIYYGDGNKLQGKLPFPLKSREELALSKYEPSEDEKKLWRKIEEYPKAHG